MHNGVEILVQQDVAAASDIQLLEDVADRLYQMGYVRQSFKQALADRERAYPTGLPTTSIGVSIPHTDAAHVNRNAIVAITLREPVEFREMGGAPQDTVDVECLFVLLLNSNDRQLKLLMGFMKVIQNEQDLLAIKNARDPETIRGILKRYLDEVLAQSEDEK